MIPKSLDRYGVQNSGLQPNTILSENSSLSSRYHQIKQRKEDVDKHHQEVRNEKGYIIGLACGPLKKERYINQAIEKELVEFKKEIE